jgi:hypothetical protein
VMDVSTLFPAEALKWATTQKEVADGLQMISDLEGGRRGIQEAGEIAGRILNALDLHGMESFPAIQEGHTRIEAVDAALASIEKHLMRAETELVVDQLELTERASVNELQAKMDELGDRFASVPTTAAEVDARRTRMRARIEAADKEAFKAGYDLQSLSATALAVGKWMDDHRSELKGSPDDERLVRGRIRAELALVDELTRELSSMRGELAATKGSADSYVVGEDELRTTYRDALHQQHLLVARAESRATPSAQEVADRAHELRRSVETLRTRIGTARSTIRGQLAKRAEVLRAKVVQEQERLAEYQKGLAAVAGEARSLVGKMTLDSFKRVRSQFYDLVLKANVGTVDVSFTRKQDKTQQIQELSMEKDRELKTLEDEFKEVLQDIE